MPQFENIFAGSAPDALLPRLMLRRLLLRGLLLAAALPLALFYLGFQGAEAQGEEPPFRLHIVANSDSAFDQALKLQVRDAVVAYLTPLLAEVRTRGEARRVVEENLPRLEALAAGITAEYGYGAAAEVGIFSFPPRRYGSVYMAAGEYQALRLTLGEGAGHNWWCVLFPPLCFVDECGEFEMKNGAAEGSLLEGERQVRLKLYEIFYENSGA